MDMTSSKWLNTIVSNVLANIYVKGVGASSAIRRYPGDTLAPYGTA